MTKKTITWRELKALNPQAFDAHVENVLDWMDDVGSCTIEQDGDRLTQSGHFPGEEYGGDITVVWDGTCWEEAEDTDEEE